MSIRPSQLPTSSTTGRPRLHARGHGLHRLPAEEGVLLAHADGGRPPVHAGLPRHPHHAGATQGAGPPATVPRLEPGARSGTKAPAFEAEGRAQKPETATPEPHAANSGPPGGGDGPRRRGQLATPAWALALQPARSREQSGIGGERTATRRALVWGGTGTRSDHGSRSGALR